MSVIEKLIFMYAYDSLMRMVYKNDSAGYRFIKSILGYLGFLTVIWLNFDLLQCWSYFLFTCRGISKGSNAELCQVISSSNLLCWRPFHLKEFGHRLVKKPMDTFLWCTKPVRWCAVSWARKTFFWIPCLQVVTKSLSFGLKLLSDPILELFVMVVEYAVRVPLNTVDWGKHLT